ncbi:growth-regulating factor 3 [Durio zibethinus]|uniref:Growth-regulating factor n=1 Tax=Durio zibethinus TaxID=66656 RepID=A0A6P5YV48_DURZI|nr:growth-regulating factor 3 [Durio zibethinus]
MDLHLKQWRNQHESEQQPSAKIPKHLDPHHQQQQQQLPPGSSSLPLFVPELNSKICSSNLSALPDSNTRFTGMASYFSLAQWQELELQALIYRYMLAGAAVPPELLQPIKKSLPHSPTYFLHYPLQHYSHYQPALLQSGYWGRAATDPEPGRCRRTDGKKWRCSRDVVAGQKYCERHVHRGRNRSRKPVEMPTSSTTTSITNNNATAPFGGASGTGVGAIGCGSLKASSPITSPPLAAVANGPNNFGLSGPSPPIDLLHLNHSSSESKNEHRGLFEAHTEVDNRSDGHILRHFFDDWPRSLQESDNSGTNASRMNSATCLSISIPGNSSSDVSLKLSTGNGDQLGSRDNERDQPQLNWAAGWASNHVASMGGPLAEALRSSTSNSSPTSVLHQLPRGSASETSYVST